MRRPTAILFDIGDTVLLERRFDLQVGIAAADPGLAARAPALAGAFRAALREHHAEAREPLLARWLVDHVDELAGRPVEALEDAVWPAVVTLEPSPGIGELLAYLRGEGVALGAVSNAYFSGRILRRELERHGLGDSFAFVLSSADVGVRKPAGAIFRAALGRAGTSADTTWFVGDTWAEDIVGARQAGLTPVWSCRPGTAADDSSVARIGGWPELRAMCGCA